MASWNHVGCYKMQTLQERVFFSESAIKLEKLTKKCHIITNLHQYLHFSSCHPSSTKRSIPYSLAIHGGIYAVTQMTTTPTPLTSPNPSSTEVIPLLSSPHKFAVPYSLMPLQPNHNSNPSPLITIYYPGLLKLKWILRESFHILSSDLSTLNFLKIPFTIHFCRTPNFRQILHPSPYPICPISALPLLTANPSSCKPTPMYEM